MYFLVKLNDNLRGKKEAELTNSEDPIIPLIILRAHASIYLSGVNTLRADLFLSTTLTVSALL